MIRLLLLLLLTPAHAGESEVQTSVFGAVLGPMDHELTDDERERLLGQFDAFSDAMTALSEQRWGAAATAFESVASTTGWYEAAYNGALARRAGGEYRAALTGTDRALGIRAGDHAALFLRASLLQGLGRYSDSKAVVTKALASAREQGLAREEVVGLLNLGAVERLLGHPEPALDAYASAATKATTLGDPALEAAALAGAGYTHAVRGSSADAERSMRAARGAADRADASTSFAEIELSLAGLALQAGDRESAGRLVDGALADSADFGDTGRRAGVLLGAAGLQRELGRAGPASRSLSQAEGLLSGSELTAQLADVLVLRATWSLNDGDPADAETGLRRALTLLEPLQAPLALAGARLKLGRALLEQQQYGAARASLDAARATLDATGATELRRQARVLSSELHRRQGDLDRAADELSAAQGLSAGAPPAVRARLAAELVLLQAARGDVDAALTADAALAPAARDLLPDEVRARVQLQIAYALHGAGRLDDAIGRARAALRHADEELTDAARQLVVESYLATDRTADAEAFLAEQGAGAGTLASRVEGRSAIDRFNDAVDAFNADRFEAAADGFRAVADDPLQPTDRRSEAEANYTTALLLLAQKRDARGEPSGALVALQRAARTGTGVDAAKAGLLAIGRLEDPAEIDTFGTLAADHATRAGESLLAGQAWMAVGDARFETDADGARSAYRSALDAWGQAPDSLGWRATVSWNLGLIAWNADDLPEARARLEAARTLATEAGNTSDAREIAAQLDELK